MMKKLFVVLAVMALVSLVAAGAAMAGIANSKHNLSNSATPAGRNYVATNTDEICVFCHTPHGAAAGWKPIWNRTVDNTTAFTTYGTTLAGTVTGTPSERTRLCFSCHDGVTALNALNNPPNAAGGAVTMAGNNTISGNAVVSFDLSDDHPIGIVYNNGTASLRTLTAAAGAVVKITALNTPTGTTGTSVVECSSCHEPHSENPAFLPLAGGNTASQLCLTCHIK